VRRSLLSTAFNYYFVSFYFSFRAVSFVRQSVRVASAIGARRAAVVPVRSSKTKTKIYIYLY
jgi:hypothetical protein